MREQRNAFFTALMFLTRLPCPAGGDHGGDSLGASTLYFPVVGLVVGSIGAATYVLVGWGYGAWIAAIFGIAAAAITTGAFHEDAFADVCDGFGGWTPERRLAIMRDSRLGSFGVLGLVLLLSAKIALVAELPAARAPLAFIVAHVVSRWATVLMMALFPKVADSESSARPFTVTPLRLAIATLIMAAVSLSVGIVTAVMLGAISVLVCVWAGRFFRGWIGGISGDCLGATNQVIELVCYGVIAKSPWLEMGARHLTHLK